MEALRNGDSLLLAGGRQRALLFRQEALALRAERSQTARHGVYCGVSDADLKRLSFAAVGDSQIH